MVRMQDLETRISTLTGWQPPAYVRDVPHPPRAGDDFVGFVVAPWQLGLDARSSVKGPSKLCYIINICTSFLSQPYNSLREPLDLLFSRGAVPGQPVEAWSMIHCIGMGKSSACRMVLEMVIDLRLSDAELVVIGPQVKALLRMHAVYEPAATDEEQLVRAMSTKVQLTTRPRPDPLMWAKKFSDLILSQGHRFQEVIGQKIDAFNQDKAQAFQIGDAEQCFIRLFMYQNAGFVQALDYHYMNHVVSESALPLRVWSLTDLSPDTKVQRSSGPGSLVGQSGLWQEILKWTPEKNEAWLLRAIGTFLKNVKLEQRKGRKMNMQKMAKGFRDIDNPTLHDQACLWVHFLPELQAHCNMEQLNDLTSKFYRGYLGKELEEKVKLMDPALKIGDFTFVSRVTGQLVQQAVQNEGAELASQQAELVLAQNRLQREVQEFEEYQRNLRAFHARNHEEKVLCNLEAQKALGVAADAFCDLWTPVRRLKEAGVVPYINACINEWTNKQMLSMEHVYRAYIVELDKLGLHWHTNVQPCIRIVADGLASAPGTTCAIFFAPNVGKVGDAYEPENIAKAQDEVDQLLREDHLNLQVGCSDQTYLNSFLP